MILYPSSYRFGNVSVCASDDNIHLILRVKGFLPSLKDRRLIKQRSAVAKRRNSALKQAFNSMFAQSKEI